MFYIYFYQNYGTESAYNNEFKLYDKFLSQIFLSINIKIVLESVGAEHEILTNNF